ncbi:MAG: rane protein of unknown function [Pseudonocardiales bacterium]|nr:rane protein of unknown function [Pseudonocardiales bacterium]
MAMDGHFGLCRALSAVPAMIGSALVLLVMFGWLGQWDGLLSLSWIAAGSVVFSRTGERVAVRLGAGFRRPTATQTALLDPAWTAALSRCGLTRSHVDLYMQRSAHPNAFAAGRRSVAVTTGLLTKFQTRQIATEQLTAVLVHELAHLSSRATNFAMITLWLAAPWRFISRLVIGIGLATVGRCQPRRPLLLVVLAGLASAVADAIQQRQLAVAFVLISLPICAVVCPLAAAWVSRQSEHAADRYAASVGLGPHLAQALQILSGEQMTNRTPVTRLLSLHPDVGHRIVVLNGADAR